MNTRNVTKIALVASVVVLASVGGVAAHGVQALTMPYTGFGDPDGLTGRQLTPEPAYIAAYAGRTASDAPTGTQPRIALAAGEVDEVNPLAATVREVNARFIDVNAALKEGYAPIPCTSGVEGGAMGIHYVNGTYLNDPAVDIGKPEAVMYEPQADGSMELVGVEYITFKGPANLGGQLFAFNGAPNRYGLDPFYELHVWAWRDNPKGTFADMNPDVSCAAAKEVAAQ